MNNTCSTCPLGLLCHSKSYNVTHHIRADDHLVHYAAVYTYTYRVKDTCPGEITSRKAGRVFDNAPKLYTPKGVALFRKVMRGYYSGE